MTLRRQTAESAAYLAERYWPGLDEATARSAMRRLVDEPAFVASDAVTEILVCTYVPYEQAMLVLLRAGSRDEVAAIGQRAGIEFDRIVEAVVLPQRREPDAGQTIRGQGDRSS
jgi:hypothetical protein